MNARVSAIGRLPPAAGTDRAATRTETGPKSARRVFLGGWTEVPVFDFAALAADQTVRGPAVVESDTTTVLLRPGDNARFDARGWLDIATG